MFFSHGILPLLLVLPSIVPLRGQVETPTPGFDPNTPGLLEPTPEEQAWMDENMIQVDHVSPNLLAMTRVSNEQNRKGAVGFDIEGIPVADDGAEFSGTTLKGGRKRNPSLRLQGESVRAESTPVMAYPSAVDNSAESWFPPVGHQLGGSCASFSTTYYTMTSQVARLRGFNVKTDSVGAHKFSTRFIYNQINNGGNNGSSIGRAYQIMLTNGCATLQSWPNISDFVSWPIDPAIWREAITYRMDTSGSVGSLDTDAGLAKAKQMLANGYIFNFATNVHQWVFSNLKNDPSTTADDDLFASGVPVTRQLVCTYVDSITGKSGHGMTVVGYNDNVWIDLNNNGKVDPGEKGAFRIVNNGSSWQDRGYVWIAYDALKATSAVAGGPNPATREAAFWGYNVHWISARASYSPTLVAEVTLNTAARNQLSLAIGRGATTATTPSYTWTPWSLQNKAGALAFDGTTTPVQAAFVFDCTDLVSSGAGNRWFVSLKDNASGSPGTMVNLRFIDTTNVPVDYQGTNPAGGLPKTVDNATLYAYADNVFVHNVAPTLTAQPKNVTVTAGQTATFSVTATGTAPLSYQWKKNGTAVSGATSASTTTPLTTGSDNGALFTVTVKNGAGSVTSNPAILSVNRSPVANAQSVTTTFNTAKAITLSGSDPDGYTLTYAIVTQPAHGTLTGTAPSVTYTPTTNYSGSDSFTFKVTNSKGAVSANATVSITVNDNNGGPAGYTWCAYEYQTVKFSKVVDVAYGARGKFKFKYGVTGSITFNNATFGDPIVGVFKAGYYKNAKTVVKRNP